MISHRIPRARRSGKTKDSIEKGKKTAVARSTLARNEKDPPLSRVRKTMSDKQSVGRNGASAHSNNKAKPKLMQGHKEPLKEKFVYGEMTTITRRRSSRNRSARGRRRNCKQMPTLIRIQTMSSSLSFLSLLGVLLLFLLLSFSSSSSTRMVVLAVDTVPQTSSSRATTTATTEHEKRKQQQRQQQQNHEQYEHYRQQQNELIVSIDNSSYLDPLSAMYSRAAAGKTRQPQPSRIIYAAVDPENEKDENNNELDDSTTTKTKTTGATARAVNENSNGEEEVDSNNPNDTTSSTEFIESYYQVEYLGILVDGGRHYFPIPWIKRLLKQMYYMKYNLLHLRLTDDQIFAIQLNKHPELTFGSVSTHYYYTPPESDNNEDNDGTTKKDSSSNTHLHPHRNYYTIEELRELNAYAKSFNITIMPEINIPGHGGAWAGIKGLIVDTCPIFICNKGYGIPLNVTHPKFLPTLKDILQEIIDVFQQSEDARGPTFLHLGGDEVHMSLECLKEGILNGRIHVNEQLLTDEDGNDYSDMSDHRNIDYVVKNIFNYTHFEDQVRNMIQNELHYKEDTIVRWERTVPMNRKDTQNYESSNRRTGNMLHFWETLPGQYLNATKGPYFVSRGLYMDTNKLDGAYTIYQKTRQIINNAVLLHDNKDKNPNVYLRGIIVGAFELSPANFWDRNLLGRMLAVSMGVHSTKKQLQSYVNKTTVFVPDRGGNLPQGELTFHQHYRHYCEDILQWPKWLCSKQGVPTLPLERYGAKWSQTWNKWIEGICTRVTEYKETLEFRVNKQQHSVLMENVFSSYWQDYGTLEIEDIGEDGTTTQRQLQQHPPQLDDEGNSEEHDAASSNVLLDEMFRHHQVENVGILLDLVNSLVLPETIQSIMNHTMSSLGLNFLQLRFVDDSGFSLQLGGGDEITTGKSYHNIS